MKKILLCLLIILITAGCEKKNNENIKPDVDNQVNNNHIVEGETEINTNSKYQETKNVDGLTFYGASLIKINDDCLFEVTIKNNNTSLLKFEYIKITLLDEQNNSLTKLTGLVTNGTLKSNEEKVISSYYNGDIDKVFDVKYEIIK